jgi:hypothetical protein
LVQRREKVRSKTNATLFDDLMKPLILKLQVNKEVFDSIIDIYQGNKEGKYLAFNIS